MLLFEESKVKSTKQKARGKAKTNAHTQLFATEPILNGKYDVRPEFECTFYTPYVRTWILELEIFVYQFNEVKKVQWPRWCVHTFTCHEWSRKQNQKRKRTRRRQMNCVCLSQISKKWSMFASTEFVHSNCSDLCVHLHNRAVCFFRYFSFCTQLTIALNF